MLEVNNFNAIRISLASPEQIRAGPTARSPSRRRSTTARSSRRRTVSSASTSSVPPRTWSATAASTSASATRASSATSAASKSRAARCAASAWATSSWPRRSATSGSSRARPVAARPAARHLPAQPGARPLLRAVHRHRASTSTSARRRSARVDEEMAERIARRARGGRRPRRHELEAAIAETSRGTSGGQAHRARPPSSARRRADRDQLRRTLRPTCSAADRGNACKARAQDRRSSDHGASLRARRGDRQATPGSRSSRAPRRRCATPSRTSSRQREVAGQGAQGATPRRSSCATRRSPSSAAASTSSSHRSARPGRARVPDDDRRAGRALHEPDRRRSRSCRP